MMSSTLETLSFNNTFARLPQEFYSRLAPVPYQKPHYLVSFNEEVAELIGLDPQQASRPEFINYFGGKELLPGSEPLAMLYAGHQFGHYVPQLGDGRAILLGEIRNGSEQKWDIQLKGSGQTPYSRDGDGRAVLRSTIREYLCSEAMHGLGIATTRALCIIGNDEEVYREQIESGAILTRIAQSHVRFGSFEVFYYRQQFDHIKVLTDYVIEHHFPELVEATDKYIGLLDKVVTQTARMIAQWQAVGFSHGVMNTDNMSILGHTLDYGPFGFMETYNPGYICNHSDHHGRYAFNKQPNIGVWNLTCLAQALTSLISVDAAKQCLQAYEAVFKQHFMQLMTTKLGLKETTEETHTLLFQLLEIMHRNHVDYTQLFRSLGSFSTDNKAGNALLRDLFLDRAAFDGWSKHYQAQLSKENSEDRERQLQMNAVNPKYVLRNYMAQIAIDKATKNKDFSEIDRLLAVLKTPFDEHPEMTHYAKDPPEWADSIQVSCSS